ncbi:hypothetical protein ES703_104198 [subsurface metagenome]
MYLSPDFYPPYVVIDYDLSKFPETPENSNQTLLHLSVVPEYLGMRVTETMADTILDKFDFNNLNPDVPLFLCIELQCKVNIIGYCHYDRFGKPFKCENSRPSYVVIFVVPKYINGFPTRAPVEGMIWTDEDLNYSLDHP